MFGNLNLVINETVENFRRANVGLVMMSTMLTCTLAGKVEWEPRLAGGIVFHGAFLWLDSFLGVQSPTETGQLPVRSLVYILASKVRESMTYTRTHAPYISILLGEVGG
jgi:hypothetical protein